MRPDILEIVAYNFIRLRDEWGFTAKNGRGWSCQWQKRKKPHWIILDVMILEMDGIESLVGLSVESEGSEDTLITFLTARGRTIRKWQDLKLQERNDYITKPWLSKSIV